MASHHPDRLPALVPDDHAVAGGPPVGAVAVQQSMGEIEFAGPSREVFVDLAPDFADIVGVDAPEPRVGCVAHLVLIAAHHGDPSGREVDPVGRQVPVPEPGVIAASGQVVLVHAGSDKTRAPDRLPR